MAQATQPVSNVIAIAFDFDDTLVPDSYDAVIKHLGYEPKTFREERYEPLLKDGWDGIPARFYTLIEESRQRPEGKKITAEFFENVGQQHAPFPGVPDMFDRVRKRCRESNASIELEFYLITSGFVEIARHTAIAQEFKAMWGC
ncbi:MAG: HAD family hydrolase [Elainellaceae cyanobacterium]